MRLLGIFVTLVFGLVIAQAQPADREALWKEVADAEKKGLPKTAAAKLQLIYDSAMQEGKHAEAIKALPKRITNEGAVQGDKPEEKITLLQTELEKSDCARRYYNRSVFAPFARQLPLVLAAAGPHLHYFESWLRKSN